MNDFDPTEFGETINYLAEERAMEQMGAELNRVASEYPDVDIDRLVEYAAATGGDFDTALQAYAWEQANQPSAPMPPPAVQRRLRPTARQRADARGSDCRRPAQEAEPQRSARLVRRRATRSVWRLRRVV